MSIIENSLKALQTGTVVRLTQNNGTTFEGTIMQNDGTDSLAIEIRTNAILRYSSIVGVEYIGKTSESVTIKVDLSQNKASLETTAVSVSQPQKSNPFKYTEMKDSLPKFSVTLSDFENAFRNLERDARVSLQGQLNKIRSGVRANEIEKVERGVDEIWKVVHENSWEYDHNINIFIGYASFFAKLYNETSESFYYGNDIRSAYLCAITFAMENDDIELYELSATYSAISIVKEPTSNKVLDAIHVLEICSAQCDDVSGIGFVLNTCKDDAIHNLMRESLYHIASNKNVTLTNTNDVHSILNELKSVCSNQKILESIKKLYQPSDSPQDDVTVEVSEDVDVLPVTNKDYVGKIVKYNFFEQKGTIENDMGIQYGFETKNIPDAKFRSTIEALSKKDLELNPVFVQFVLVKSFNSFTAINIRKCTNPQVIKHGIEYANQLFTGEHKYNEALAEYEKMLSTDKWEDAFIGMMNCYLAMGKNNLDNDYLAEMKTIADKYAKKMSKSIRNLSVVHQYYMKVGMFNEAIEQLNDLISISNEHEYNRILYCVCEKARCYKGLGLYNEAIEEFEKWLKLVSDNKLTSLYYQRDVYMYIELAESYFNVGEYDKAEEYALLSQDRDKKKAILSDIEKIKAELKEQQYSEIEENYNANEYNDEEVEENTQDSETYDVGELHTLIDGYHDDGDFDSLGYSVNSIVERAFSFGKDKLYCTLTYLTAAAYAGRFSKNADELQTVSFCVNSAMGTISSSEDITSFNITYRYNIFKNVAPKVFEKLFVSSALRTLFNQTETFDSEMNTLVEYLEKGSLCSKYPVLLPLANALLNFRNQTGYGIDEFADYKTDSSSHERVVESAKKCRESLDLKAGIFESKGRLRKTRIILFTDPNSILRCGINIACENDESKVSELKQEFTDRFLKEGKPFEFKNIDSSKVENLIDSAWDKARDLLLAESYRVKRPYERLIDPKRRNVTECVYYVIQCVFEWIISSERRSNNNNFYASDIYNASRGSIVGYLEEAYKTIGDTSEDVSDWSHAVLMYTISELLSKMEGTYDVRTKKYLYIDFLRSDHILLDEEYQPEIYSTFNSMKNFNILKRIEQHADMFLPTFEQRIDDLFSNDISKNNLRSASLIQAYAEDMDIQELYNHNMFKYLDKCIIMGRQRLKDIHEDFQSELELYESYGSLSDINGEKTAMIKESDLWFRICLLNCDFGFYATLLEMFRENVSTSSETIADRLNRQLEELDMNRSKYDFGIYTKEAIKNFIFERNFTVAENMMNSIRRNDAKKTIDYSIEPFSFLNSFIDEYPINYRVVSNFAITLKDSVCSYTGKKDLELSLNRLTNNARKDVRGGVNIIKSWIAATPAGTSRIESLLRSLGFNNITATKEAGSMEDSYLITKEKQTGRVNYRYPLPAFSSIAESDGFRVLCLYGRFDSERLIDKFHEVNTTSKHTMVLLDYALKESERRLFARKMKEEKSFATTFILIDRVVAYYLAIHYQANTVDKALMALTMPFSYYQPFSATLKLGSGSMAPELFTGRANELRSIEDPNGCNLVYGGRQLGKSALLNMAGIHIDGNSNGDRAVVVDICKMNYTSSAKCVSERLVDKYILPEGSETDDWETLIRSIRKRLNDDNPQTRIGYLLLMLDEADDFIKSCKEINYTPISLCNNLPTGRFKLVMAGLHSLSSFNRQEVLYNNNVLPHLESIIVRPFKRPEGTELLTYALAYMGFKFKPDVVSLILAKTNYFPGLIQLYCQKLLEAMKDNYANYSQTNTPPYEVTEEHIRKVLSDTSFTKEINDRLEMTLHVNDEDDSHYYTIALILAYLNFEEPDEKGHTVQDIQKVAESYNISTINNLDVEQLNELLGEMWDLNILTADGERYMFSSEGFRDLLGSKDKVNSELAVYIDTKEE